MSKKLNSESGYFSLYIRSGETMSLINELAEKRGNRNAVLNDALDIGVKVLYSREFGKDVDAEKKKREHNPSTTRELKELRRLVEEIFVELAPLEVMLAGLFNVKADELDGEDVRGEALRGGALCDLPELAAGIKADLIGRME